MSFNGTPFNDDQLDHMRSIAKLPDEQVSWCGWGTVADAKRGWCCANPTCLGKTEGKTAADKKRVWCPVCRMVPDGDGVLTHTRFCKAAPSSSPDKDGGNGS